MNGWPLPPRNTAIRGDRAFISARDYIDFAPWTKLPTHFLHWRFPRADAYTNSPPGHPNSLRLRPSKLNHRRQETRRCLHADRLTPCLHTAWTCNSLHSSRRKKLASLLFSHRDIILTRASSFCPSLTPRSWRRIFASARRVISWSLSRWLPSSLIPGRSRVSGWKSRL